MNNINQVCVYGFILVWVEIINENSLSRNCVNSTSGEGQVGGQTRNETGRRTTDERRYRRASVVILGVV